MLEIKNENETYFPGKIINSPKDRKKNLLLGEAVKQGTLAFCEVDMRNSFRMFI
jgi:hypothetical protein